jgi:hypothetical protein
MLLIQNDNQGGGMIPLDRLYGDGLYNQNFIVPAFFLPVLKAVHDKSLQRPLCIVEFGSGFKLRILLLLYAISKGVIFCAQNDLPDNKSNNFDQTIEKHFQNNPAVIVKKFFNQSCFELFENPFFAGSVDFLLTEHLLHAFNPEEHQNFLVLINYLLKRNGTAFLLTRTINSTNIIDPIALHMTKRQDELYPGFVEIITNNVYTMLGDTGQLYTSAIMNIQKPISFKCQKRSLQAWDQPPQSNKLLPTHHIITSEVVNFVTRSILANAMRVTNENLGGNLEIKESYYISPYGARIEELAPETEVAFMAAIIGKKQ